MTFIQLTNLEGKSIWVNFDWVATFHLSEDHTIITYHDDSLLRVKEGPAQIASCLG